MIAETYAAVQMLRCKSVLSRAGMGRSTLYTLVSEGLFTKPVRITSKKAAAWPSNEVDDINAARIAGKSDADIRELVIRLHAKRTELSAEQSLTITNIIYGETPIISQAFEQTPNTTKTRIRNYTGCKARSSLTALDVAA